MVRTSQLFSALLFTGTGDRRKRAYTLLLMLSPGSHRYGSSPGYTLEQIGAPAPLTQMRPSSRRDCSGAGILTCLPFRSPRLRDPLGSTNPRLTNIVEEPLPLRLNGFSPFFAATTTRILIRMRSTRSHDRASARTRRPPTRSHFCALKYR